MLSPQLGSYHLAVEAKSRFLLVQVSGSSGGVHCIGSDHLIGELGRTYMWVVRWSVNKTDGKCALSIKRAFKLNPIQLHRDLIEVPARTAARRIAEAIQQSSGRARRTRG